MRGEIGQEDRERGFYTGVEGLGVCVCVDTILDLTTAIQVHSDIVRVSCNSSGLKKIKEVSMMKVMNYQVSKARGSTVV